MAMKKKISKEDLRKAMSEAKKKQPIKRVESPLARYNELDQLVCVLCKTVVRNETVWPVHLNSKSHKDNMVLATKPKPATPSQPIASNKRPSTFVEPQVPKKVKGILRNSRQPSSSIQGLPADFFENSTATAKATDTKATTITIPKLTLTNGSNGNVEVAKSEEKPVEAKDSKDVNPSTLPEGFFDDPVKDAKARNVEYKDPIEEEWERFQKEIKEETAQSAQIIGDDQEEAATERQLDVIEEQLRNWSRVMDLVELKKRVQTSEKKQDNNDSTSDEEEYDEFLDWRAKRSYRE